MQNTALENAIRKIENSTEFSQNKTPILGARTPIRRHPPEDVQPIKSGPTTTPNIVGPWKFVGPQKRQNAVAKPICFALRLANTSLECKPRESRDYNDFTAKDLRYVRILTLSTSNSAKGNLILQLPDMTISDFFKTYEEARKDKVGFTTILEDNSCFKVVVYGLNTQDSNLDGSLSLIREVIET
jgi:hypothetical protein